MSDPYELVPMAEPPRFASGLGVLREDPDEVLDAIGADLMVHARNCVRAFGDFHLAVSGTPEAEPFFRRLMFDPALRELPWKRTHLWLTHERLAPPGVEMNAPWTSAAALVEELLAVPSDIPAEQFHVPLVSERDPAEHYERQLREHLGWREKGHDRLDFVLLTLNADGSVAGLPVGANAAASGKVDRAGGERLVKTHSAGGAVSLSLSPGMLNASRFIAVLASGAGLRGIVSRLSRGSGAMMEGGGPPAAALRPIAGELRWYVDAQAAARER